MTGTSGFLIPWRILSSLPKQSAGHPTKLHFAGFSPRICWLPYVICGLFWGSMSSKEALGTSELEPSKGCMTSRGVFHKNYARILRAANFVYNKDIPNRIHVCYTYLHEHHKKSTKCRYIFHTWIPSVLNKTSPGLQLMMRLILSLWKQLRTVHFLLPSVNGVSWFP